MGGDFSEDTGNFLPHTWYEDKPIEDYTPEEIKYFKERDKYINKHKEKYINLYKEELLIYGFEVKFINSKKGGY